MMRFPTAVRRDPAIEAWLRAHLDDLGRVAHRWLETMRGCGDDGALTRLVETAYGDMRPHVGEKSTQAST